MKKKWVKIFVDIVMLAIMFTLYSKRAVSMHYHEVAGLILAGAFLLHQALQWNWIKGISKRIFKKELPLKTKICYWVDVFLFVAMGFVSVSGVLISKTILTGISAQGMFWKNGHYFAAAMSVVLCGIHLGLHWGYLKTILFRKIPQKLAKPLGVCCLILIMGFGVFEMVESGFSRWLVAPFMAGSIENHGGPQGMNAQSGADISGSALQNQKPDEQTGNGNGENRFHQKNGSTFSGQRGEGAPNQNVASQSPVISAMMTFAQYFSIAFLFAAITALIENLLKKRVAIKK